MKQIIIKLRYYSDQEQSSLLIPVILFFIFLMLFTPNFWFTSDLDCWKYWSWYTDQEGMNQAYHCGTNYPPIYLYILRFFDILMGGHENALLHYSRIKWITLLFDFLPVLIMFFAGMRALMQKNEHWLLLFNAAYLFNTLAWGQIDAIHSNLSLLAIVLAIRYPMLAASVFIIALNTKLQAIIFFPIIGIMILPHLLSFKNWIKISLAAVLTELAIVFPFLLAGEFKNYFEVMVDSVDYFKLASLNAYNFWHLILSADPITVSDQDTFLAITYKQWGLLLFCGSSALVLIPLLKKVLKQGFQFLSDKKGKELVFLSAAMISLSFFFFNTQMHERYSHPAMIFLFFYALFSRDFIPYILVSIAYLLNMERILEFFDVPYYTFIFIPEFSASLFLIALILIYKNLFRDFLMKNGSKNEADSAPNAA